MVSALVGLYYMSMARKTPCPDSTLSDVAYINEILNGNKVGLSDGFIGISQVIWQCEKTRYTTWHFTCRNGRAIGHVSFYCRA